MQTLTVLEFFTRLAVGLGCGALIGAERQWRARMAGLRTNALVAAGATLFVLYSDVNGSANSTQVAAYVVSGIGFLGGGVILRDGFHVRGLNTAATLWCSAADLQITCKPKGEPHIRALIVNNTTGSDVVLRGIDTTRSGQDSETRLTARLLLNGDAATCLEQLVARLSLEPGIHAVHWHAAGDPATRPAPVPSPVPSPGGPGDEG